MAQRTLVIDNGASFTSITLGKIFDTAAKNTFQICKDHVLLPQASKLDEADFFAKSVLNDDVFRAIVNLIPEDWLQWNDADESPEEIRKFILIS